MELVEQATDGPRKGFNPPSAVSRHLLLSCPRVAVAGRRERRCAMSQALPANPNLDWLKKAAKHRLVELRVAQRRQPRALQRSGGDAAGISVTDRARWSRYNRPAPRRQQEEPDVYSLADRARSRVERQAVHMGLQPHGP